LLSLREVQRDIRDRLIGDDDAGDGLILDDGIAVAERLRIYRNTFIAVATRALRLNYPALVRLVGDDCFAAITHAHVIAHPPGCAWLDAYGADFPAFVAGWPSTSSLGYLEDVARLEWAVGRALHAPDVPPLAPAALATLPPKAQAGLRFVAHPSVRLLRTTFPADAIWRAVLSRDDDALAAVDLSRGPAWLLVQRTRSGIDVAALDEPAWRFTDALCAGVALQEALDAARERQFVDAPTLIAEHLRAERFVGFQVAGCASRDGAAHCQ